MATQRCMTFFLTLNAKSSKMVNNNQLNQANLIRLKIVFHCTFLINFYFSTNRKSQTLRVMHNKNFYESLNHEQNYIIITFKNCIEKMIYSMFFKSKLSEPNGSDKNIYYICTHVCGQNKKVYTYVYTIIKSHAHKYIIHLRIKNTDIHYPMLFKIYFPRSSKHR